MGPGACENLCARRCSNYIRGNLPHRNEMINDEYRGFLKHVCVCVCTRALAKPDCTVHNSKDAHRRAQNAVATGEDRGRGVGPPASPVGPQCPWRLHVQAQRLPGCIPLSCLVSTGELVEEVSGSYLPAHLLSLLVCGPWLCCPCCLASLPAGGPRPPSVLGRDLSSPGLPPPQALLIQVGTSSGCLRPAGHLSSVYWHLLSLSFPYYSGGTEACLL